MRRVMINALLGLASDAARRVPGLLFTGEAVVTGKPFDP